MDGNFFWSLFIIFFMVIYFMMLFSVIIDLFRDHQLNGWFKALWILALIVFPLISLLIYVIARGGGMARRSQAAAVDMQKQQQEYIRNAAGTDPAAQIAKAQELLNAGTITQDEFNTLKAKALA